VDNINGIMGYVGAFKKSLYSGMCTILALVIRTVKNNGHSALI